MEGREFATKFADLGKEIAEQQGHGNFAPTCMVEGTHDNVTIFVMVGVPTGYMYAAVQSVIKEFGEEIKSIALTVDSYMDPTEFEGVEDPEEFKRRLEVRVPLEKRFKDGDPAVKESLHTVIMSPDWNITINQPYKWTPVDGWEWDEPRIIDDGSSDWEWDRLINGLPRRDLTEIMYE
jgi:hypothetical protein